jgi:hypothetical protein
MSHNLYTLNNEGGDVQCYHGANDGVIYIGHGETQTYPDTSFTNGNKLEFYDSNPINTINGASFNKRAGTNWIQSITLPAGKYELRASDLLPVSHPTSASGIAYFPVKSGTTTYRRGLNNSTPSYFDDNYMYNKSVCCVLDFSSAGVTLFLEIQPISISGTLSVINSDDRISETAYLFIRKLA